MEIKIVKEIKGIEFKEFDGIFFKPVDITYYGWFSKKKGRYYPTTNYYKKDNTPLCIVYCDINGDILNERVCNQILNVHFLEKNFLI